MNSVRFTWYPEGMEYLHSKEPCIIHGDLKSPNGIKPCYFRVFNIKLWSTVILFGNDVVKVCLSVLNGFLHFLRGFSLQTFRFATLVLQSVLKKLQKLQILQQQSYGQHQRSGFRQFDFDNIY